jgi:hypothetical protein
MRLPEVFLPFAMALAVCACLDQEMLADAPSAPEGPQAGPAPAWHPVAAPGAAPASCAACVAQGGAWCTNPRRCAARGEACFGLTLADAPACVNDLAPPPPPPSASAITPEGMPISGRLQDFPGVRFAVAPGHCYSVGFELGQPSSPSYVYPFYKLRTPGESRDEKGELLAQRLKGQSGRLCPSHPGTIDFYFVNDHGHNFARNAGSGVVTVQLFKGPPAPRPSPGAVEHDANRTARPPIVAPPVAPAPAPQPAKPSTPRAAPEYTPQSTSSSCLRTCFFDRNDCRSRCRGGGGSGSSFRSWCENECDRQQDSCKRSCIDRVPY